ncbi:MAG: trypsin-like peptidase domain-containing protein [Ruminiclostridium sp.]|nr:trypsin-like peptidase domain-containing protein [Ruminiclostridium sp.]
MNGNNFDSGYNNGYSQNYNQSYDVNNNPVQTGTPPQPKKEGKAGFVAGIIATALVVGGVAGFAGSVIGNNLGTVSLPTISGSETPGEDNGNTSSSEEEKTESSIPKPETTIDLSGAPVTRPLDEEKINDATNSHLLNAEELYAKVKDTVVLLYNYQDVQGYDEPVLSGSASGVVFTADGYIITNAHVVANATKMTAVVYDYENDEITHEYEATIIGSDTSTDLAVIKVNRDEPFKYALLGNSETVRVGQDICVLGNPKSLVSTLTKGIVSGLNRASYSGSGYGCSSIQIDAAINSGNSGGGLFDMYGNVIGIIDYKMVSTGGTTSVENIGFAISIDEAKPVINDLMVHGYVTNRPGLGINGQDISEYNAQREGIPYAGVYVTYIAEDKPVAKSGLREGDVITAVDGVLTPTINSIQTEVVKHNVGDTVELTIYRAGITGKYKEMKVTVELSELNLQ